jgi:hypothetical protein
MILLHGRNATLMVADGIDDRFMILSLVDDGDGIDRQRTVVSASFERKDIETMFQRGNGSTVAIDGYTMLRCIATITQIIVFIDNITETALGVFDRAEWITTFTRKDEPDGSPS